MFGDKKVLGLITARGGSKGIPRKNIKLLGGKPLIAWTIDAALKSRYIDRLILSSDDNEIISIAKSLNCDVPFVRPSELATEISSSMDVVLHALDHVGEFFDFLLLLQPTSPFRTSEDIDAIIESCIKNNANMMISVARLKKHPMFMYEIINGCLKPVVKSQHQLRRQDMPSAYEHNGSMYLSKVDFLKSKKTFNTEEAMPFEMFGEANVDIDTPEDWDYAEFLISRLKKN